MNGIAMLFHHIQFPKTAAIPNSKEMAAEGNQSLFQSLLGKADAGNQLFQQKNNNSSPILPNDAQVLLSDPEGEDRTGLELHSLEGLEAELPIIWEDLKISSDGLESLLQNAPNPGKTMNHPVLDGLMNLQLTDVDSGTINSIDTDIIQIRLAEIFIHVEKILYQISNQDDVLRASPKLLELLQQWNVLKKNRTNIETVPEKNALQKEDTGEQRIWRDLLQAFERRMQVSGNQPYRSEAKVTSSDISKWLTKAMEKHGLNEKPTGPRIFNHLNTPLPQLEQYVIHINQSLTDKHADRPELIEQFQKVMRTSSFRYTPSGLNQLSITLRPDNLGEMMVRFTQINGELAVKIMVTTQAAKEMLETNMNQLRNMFLPHQVIVEKQDAAVQSNEFVQKEQNDEQLHDQEQNHSQNPNKEEHKQSEEDFETQFHEILLNEKV